MQVGENRWEFPVAITTKGMLWGTIEESRSGQRILAFRGIKYAQPPVGPLRFKPPRPLPQWSGIAGIATNTFSSRPLSSVTPREETQLTFGLVQGKAVRKICRGCPSLIENCTLGLFSAVLLPKLRTNFAACTKNLSIVEKQKKSN